MTLIQLLNALCDLVTDSSTHFLLASAMGALGFWLTWITLYASLSGWEHLTRKRASGAADSGILICCLLVGLACALLAHYALDYWSTWLTAPLGPPLQLDLGGIDG